MKKIIWIVVLVLVVLFGFGACSSYNKMVSGEETQLDETGQSLLFFGV